MLPVLSPIFVAHVDFLIVPYMGYTGLAIWIYVHYIVYKARAHCFLNWFTMTKSVIIYSLLISLTPVG